MAVMRAVLVAVLIAAGLPAFAATPAPVEAQICLTVPLTPGSRIEQRACHSKAQWDLINQNAQTRIDMSEVHLHTTSSGAWTDRP